METLDKPDCHAARRRRPDPAAPAAAAAAGRTHGQRTDRDRGPEPAARLAPSEASGRGGAARALQGRKLGVLSRQPRRQRRRIGRRHRRRWPSADAAVSKPTCSGLPPCARRAPPQRPPISRPMPRNGNASARCMRRKRMSKRRSSRHIAGAANRESAGCRDRNGPHARIARAACRSAPSASMSAPKCWRSRATGCCAAMFSIAQVRLADTYRLPFPNGSGAARLRRRAVPPGAALSRRSRRGGGGSRARDARRADASADRRFRAPRAGIPARRIRPSPPGLLRPGSAGLVPGRGPASRWPAKPSRPHAVEGKTHRQNLAGHRQKRAKARAEAA